MAVCDRAFRLARHRADRECRVFRCGHRHRADRECQVFRCGHRHRADRGCQVFRCGHRHRADRGCRVFRLDHRRADRGDAGHLDHRWADWETLVLSYHHAPNHLAEWLVELWADLLAAESQDVLLVWLSWADLLAAESQDVLLVWLLWADRSSAWALLAWQADDMTEAGVLTVDVNRTVVNRRRWAVLPKEGHRRRDAAEPRWC